MIIGVKGEDRIPLQELWVRCRAAEKVMITDPLSSQFIVPYELEEEDDKEGEEDGA